MVVFEMDSLRTDIQRVRLLRCCGVAVLRKEGFSRGGSSMPAEAPKLVQNGRGAFSISRELSLSGP